MIPTLTIRRDIPDLRLAIQNIERRPIAVEIVDRAGSYSAVLASQYIIFKANDGKEYEVHTSHLNNGSGQYYNSVAWQCYSDLFPYCSPTDEELYNLSDADYLKWINEKNTRKIWKEVTE